MGINEIGNEKGAAFAQKYLALIQKIQAVQPNATIFIQSILHTTQKKSSSTGFKNELINDHNAALSALADNKKIFYIDLNPLFDDANGAMRGELSGDGVHLKAQHYITWRDYLMTRVPTTLVQ